VETPAPVKNWIASLFVLAAIAGCVHVPEREAAQTRIATGAKVNLGDSERVKKQLFAQYGQWKGTKYEIGGLSRSGIDCSGFVYVTFKSKLGVVVPRSTDLQADAGKSVGKGELRAGDLVFFKTGLFVRHVGIYLASGRFMHASTSQGVMISRLEEDYWKSSYWKARRISS
jgi:probable lipoprotein NlpC